MPGGDRTGPMGNGPQTGRQMGYCAGYPEPGYANPGRGGPGWGMGRGRGFAGGRGMAWRHGRGGRGNGFGWGARPAEATAHLPNDPTTFRPAERDMRNDETGRIADTLEAIQRRLTELEKKLGSND